ncbi:hypothetical protein CEXT_344251 [Caerostris extrusa]|uniref:Uncharacterized protein n=1 Tax=Caerostris extrusa TaxID=172846 RepID=A0AAV4V372_CAEEX|nr:hypothetical protein CEXT_344251 [Caerostris extrusa]
MLQNITEERLALDKQAKDQAEINQLESQKLKFLNVPESKCVTYLIASLPSDVAELIAREPEGEARIYVHVKEILLKRFKLNAG